jgi:perosamine synthetase
MIVGSKVPIAEPVLGQEELDNVVDAMRSGWISSSGPYVKQFEDAFATFCGTRRAISVFNGTVALSLALSAINLQPGDEVIVPSLTFMASAATVMHLKAKPVFVDSDSRNWCMDPADIRRAITKKTKAIMPVHLYGHPCKMDEIMEIAEKRDIYVIEDAAEAHGAEFEGKRVGAIGDIGCFSFYANKIVTTGEGGMVTTSNDELAARMQLIKNHGMPADHKYWHPVLGYNFRMTNIQAAIGAAQMPKIENFIATKIRIAERYTEAFKGNPNITCQETMPWAKNVYWMYSVRVGSEKIRDKLSADLSGSNIDCRNVFIPCNEQPIALDTYGRTMRQTPVAAQISRTGLSIPCGAGLTDEQQDLVIEAVKKSVG